MYRLIGGGDLPPVSQSGFELLAKLLNEQRARRQKRDLEWMRNHIATQQPDRRMRRSIRRSTIRAATIASAILGATAVSAFARGEPVRLPTPSNMVMEVALSGSISRSGHGAVQVNLRDDEDKYLAGLCVYQELPALDQLASLALHVQSGGLTDILTVGNVYNISPEAFAHPLLAEKKREQEIMDELMVPVLPRTDHELRREMMRAHDLVMMARYQRRIFLDVLGRRGPAAFDLYCSMKGHRP
jgi:hypothetical protein